jgi:hypothetical protein
MLSKFEKPAFLTASINIINCPVGSLDALSLGASVLAEPREGVATVE